MSNDMLSKGQHIAGHEWKLDGEDQHQWLWKSDLGIDGHGKRQGDQKLQLTQLEWYIKVCWNQFDPEHQDSHSTEKLYFENPCADTSDDASQPVADSLTWL